MPEDTAAVTLADVLKVKTSGDSYDLFLKKLRGYINGKGGGPPKGTVVRQILIRIAKTLELDDDNNDNVKIALQFLQHLEHVGGSKLKWLDLGVDQLLKKVLSILSKVPLARTSPRKDTLYDFYDTVMMVASSVDESGKDMLRKAVVPTLLAFSCEDCHCVPALVEGMKVVNSLLQSCPVSPLRALGSDAAVKSNLMSMGKKVALLGDMELQMGFVEAIFRLTTVDERRRLGGHCFHYQSITKCFLAIHDAEFEPDCRKFLNALNGSSPSLKCVVSLPCASAYVGDVQLQRPKDKGISDFWVDFNPRSSSMTLFIQDTAAESDVWDTIAVNEDNVKSYQVSDDPTKALQNTFRRDLERASTKQQKSNRMSIAIASLLISGGKTTVCESPMNSAANSQVSPVAPSSQEARPSRTATPDLNVAVLKTPKTSTPNSSPASQCAPHSDLPGIAQDSTHLSCPPVDVCQEEDESPIVSSAPVPVAVRANTHFQEPTVESLPAGSQDLPKSADAHTNTDVYPEPKPRSKRGKKGQHKPMQTSAKTKEKRPGSKRQAKRSCRTSENSKKSASSSGKLSKAVEGNDNKGRSKTRQKHSSTETQSPFRFPENDNSPVPLKTTTRIESKRAKGARTRAKRRQEKQASRPKIISQAPSLELTRSKPAHIPPIDRFSQEDIGDDIATEREISPVQVTGGHSNPLNDKTAEEHKRVSEYNLSFAIDVPVEANTSPVISANEASPRHLVASPSPQPCGPQVEAIVASHECIASRSSGSYNLTPCSVRIKNMYSSAKPTPSEDCPVVEGLQLNAASILEDFSSSMLNVMGADIDPSSSRRRKESKTLRATKPITAEKVKKRRGVVTDQSPFGTMSPDYNDSPKLMCPVTPAECNPAFSPGIQSCDEPNDSTGDISSGGESTGASILPQTLPTFKTVMTKDSPFKMSFLTSDSGLGISRDVSAIATPNTLQSDGTSMVQHRRLLGLETSSSHRNYRKRAVSVDDDREVNEVIARLPKRRRKQATAESRRTPLLSGMPSPVAKRHSSSVLDEDYGPELEEDQFEEGSQIGHASPALEPFTQPTPVIGSDIQSLMQSFGTRISHSQKAQQHAIGSFSKSMANFATGVVDQLWNENIQKRREALSEFHHSLSPELVALEEDIRTQQKAQEKALAMMKDYLNVQEVAGRSQRQRIRSIKGGLSLYVDTMSTLESGYHERKAVLQKSLLAHSRREHGRMQDQIRKMQVAQMRRTLQATILQVK